MKENEKLDLILAGMQGIESEMHGMKVEMQSVKEDVQELNGEMQGLKQSVIGIHMHLENVTDWNIRLLAENHSNLIDKLNRAIPTADKNLTYEVKVDYLIEKVDNFEKEIQDLKGKIA